MNRGVQLLLPVLALVVGFAAGTGFGVVVLGGGEGSLAASGDVEVGDGAGAHDTAPRDVDRGGDAAHDEDAGDDPGTVRRRGVSADGVMIENAMRGEAAVATTGGGVITGTVSDERGRPVAGAEITARTDMWSLDEPPPGIDDEEDDTLDERIRNVVRAYRFEEATRRTTTSGADGSYRLEGLVAATFNLSVEAPGYTFRTAAGADWSASPGDVRDWIASPVMAVVVVATLPDGSEADDYLLEYTDHAANSSFSEHREKGDDPLELAPGEYEFVLSSGDDSRYRSEPQNVVVVEGQPTRVEAQLVVRPGVTGSVTFGGEQPTLVGVAALRVGDGVDAVPENLLRATHVHWTEEPFDYALFDLPPGSYLLGAVLRNGRVLESRSLEIAADLTEEDFAIGDMDVRDYTIVRVRGPAGEPVREVSFSVGYRSEDLSFDGNLEVARQADGSYRVPHAVPGSPSHGFSGWSQSGEAVPGADYTGITYHLTVTSPQFGRTRVEFDPATQRELDVEFGEPAFAIVTVAGYAESEWRGRVQANLRTVGDSSGTGAWLNHEQQKTSPQGVIRVGPAEPGAYAVVLMVNTPQNGWKEVAVQEVQLAIGDTPLTMSIPDLHQLTVECEGGALDLDLHRDPDVTQTTDFLDEGVREGQLTHFHAIVPGRYRVRAYGDGSPGEMLVDVPAGGTIVFRPTAYNSLRVEHVNDDLRPHLRKGDIVLEVGGQSLEGAAQIRAALALAQATEIVDLVVRRGASTMDVTLPSRLLEYGPFTNWTR